MKIMHMADYHLDSAFSGFSKENSEAKRAMLRECFTDSVRIAKERGVKLILIAGDLFDTPFCTAATRKAVFDAMADAGCPIVISPGNHDYYNKNGTYADKSLPENVFVFSSDELGRFDFDELGLSIIGYAFTSDRYEENPLGADVPLSSENVNILCAHAELGAPLSKYAPISPNAIARCGFAYAALGHVHNAPDLVKAGNTLIGYSGFPQGRSFDELGAGGAYIVDIDLETKTATAERVILSKMRYEIEKVDITACASDEDVIRAVTSAIERGGYGESTALRVRLVGAIPSEYRPDVSRIESDSAFLSLALLQVRDESIANLDLDYLERDMTVKGEVYRRLLPSLNSADENERRRASAALRFALAALDKRELSID